MVFSKEEGTLVIEEIEVARTCFYYVKKSNRNFNRDLKRGAKEAERANKATKIVNLVDPITLVSHPTSSAKISSHISSILALERQKFQLSQGKLLNK